MSEHDTHRSPADKAKATAENALEEIKVASNQVVDRVRELVEEGNVRRIFIKKDGKTLLEVPLTIAAGAGAAVILISPVLAAIGAMAALVTDVTLAVEREEGGSGSDMGKGGSERSQKPQDAPASKQVTDHEGSDAAKSGNAGSGSQDKTIGK